MIFTRVISTTLLIGILLFINFQLKNTLPTEEYLQSYINIIKEVKTCTADYLVKINRTSQDIILKTVGHKLNLNIENPVHLKLFTPLMSLKKILKIKRFIGIENIGYNSYLSYLLFLKINIFHIKYYIIPGAILAVLCIFFRLIKLYPISSIMGRFSFIISRIALSFTSLLLITSWIMVKKAFWLNTGIAVFIGPAIILVFSCIVVKNYDPNFPIFNRVIKNMILPITAFILMYSSQIIL